MFCETCYRLVVEIQEDAALGRISEDVSLCIAQDGRTMYELMGAMSIIA